ncbi:MAG TPA: SMC-Scp complex subunit ScpB [Dehalococcoidia bacterium]|nr:SMC-Scp complex subunit ScpB [Dehalococcoidia bacterium]
MNKRLPSLSKDNLPAVIESILFVADGAVEISMLSRALRRPADAIEGALAELETRCAEGGTRLQRTRDAVQLVTSPETGPYVERFLGLESRQRLSGAALESLAIIAYKQPMTRAGVEQIRGVNSDGAIASLIARGLVEEVGRAPSPGRPALLGTTLRFLEHFGLSKPGDLPPLPANGSILDLAEGLVEAASSADEDEEAETAEAAGEASEGGEAPVEDEEPAPAG